MKEMLSPFAASRPAYAGDDARFGGPIYAELPERAPRRKLRRRTRMGFLLRLAAKRGAGLVLATLFLSSTFVYGAVRGGQYQDFIAQNGSPADLFARAVGLRLDAITISGQKELTPVEILEAAGISGRNSLLLLDAHEVREKLKAVPLIKDADVRKLYPNRLMIEIVERAPYGLWQKDGQVVIIAADGTAIDVMRDQRFADLPFVVGEGANKRVSEFLKILEAAGELRSHVRAGVLVSERRWNLKLNNGVDVKLPETDPAAAAASLARLQREGRIIEKDIVAIDMRMPGRAIARLSEDAANARAEALARKPKGKGGTT